MGHIECAVFSREVLFKRAPDGAVFVVGVFLLWTIGIRALLREIVRISACLYFKTVHDTVFLHNDIQLARIRAVILCQKQKTPPFEPCYCYTFTDISHGNMRHFFSHTDTLHCPLSTYTQTYPHSVPSKWLFAKQKAILTAKRVVSDTTFVLIHTTVLHMHNIAFCMHEMYVHESGVGRTALAIITKFAFCRLNTWHPSAQPLEVIYGAATTPATTPATTAT
jgi:hypothetical protein